MSLILISEWNVGILWYVFVCSLSLSLSLLFRRGHIAVSITLEIGDLQAFNTLKYAATSAQMTRNLSTRNSN